MKVEDRGLRIEDSNMNEDDYPQIDADINLLGAKRTAKSVSSTRLEECSMQQAVTNPELKADGLKRDAMRFALCSLPFFICVNRRESAVSS